MKIKKAIKKLIRNTFKKKVEAKVVHICHNDKFIAPFVEFLNTYFPQNEHAVLCIRAHDEFDFPLGDNVLEINSIYEVNLTSEKIEKIIFHSLFTNSNVDFLYKNKEYLDKSYWVMWGGDLYSPTRDIKNDYVRKHFKGYLNAIDREYAINKFGMKDNFFDINYLFPIKKEWLDEAKNTIQPKKIIKIQINNSCDESTLQVLDMLTQYKDENIKITTILSYGATEFKESIIEKGKSIFGDKFYYYDIFLKPQEYVKELAENDVLILNQSRQQGVGNTIASLYLGKKVFIREEVSVTSYFRKQDIQIFSTQDIQNLPFDEFLLYEERDATVKNVSKYLSGDYTANKWREAFDDI